MRTPLAIKRQVPAGLLLAVGLGLSVLVGCGGEDLAEHLEKGQSLFRGGHYEEAQLEGLYVLLRDPENEEALHLVAFSLLWQDRDGEAEAYFQNLAEISPDYAREAAAVYDTKARADYDAGEKNRAMRRWNTALGFHLEQDLGPYAFFMARCAYDQRNWQQAAQLYARALANFPDSSAVRTAYFPYGVSLHRLERYEEALAVLESFLRAYPRHGQHHEAVWLYQELLIREARNSAARMDYERAIAQLRKALRYNATPPKTAEALLELGQCYEHLQDYSAAASCYQRIVESNTAGSGRIYDSAVARLDKLEKARLR